MGATLSSPSSTVTTAAPVRSVTVTGDEGGAAAVLLSAAPTEEGYGTIAYPSGDPRRQYVGDFHLGKRHGRGRLLWANGSSFEGEWENDVICGYGVLHWNGGMIYEGQWRQNQFDGEGKFRWPDRQLYCGSFRQGKQHGRGRLDYPVNDPRLRRFFDGEWVDGLRHGLGRLEWATGASYDGAWHGGKRQGLGTHVFATGECYSGEWVNGKREGRGIRRWANGDFCEGTWKDDKRHGHGIFVEAHGRRQNEYCEKGELALLPNGQKVPQSAQTLLVLCVEYVAANQRLFAEKDTVPLEVLEKVLAARRRLEPAAPLPSSELQELRTLQRTWFGV